MTKEYIIGIDLGTTNSVASVCVDGRIEIIDNGEGPLVPSYVGITPDENLIVGSEARNQYLLYPERTVKSIKRKMGESSKVPLAGKDYLPQEISAMILREIKVRAEAYLKSPVTKAVITVPAYFSDAQRQATREAGELAGLEVLRIINEPTAACLAYEAKHHEKARTVLAYDLGGGTFDVSVVNIDGELVEVIASHGDNHLGGDDFDEALYDKLVAHLMENSTESSTFSEIAHNRISRAAEEAKIRLSSEFSARILEDNLPRTNNELTNLDYRIERTEFEEVIEHFLKKTTACIHKALNSSGKKPGDIEEIVLVGGSTRIPAVSSLLERELKIPVKNSVHPDLAVAYGAGVLAARLAGSKEQRILVDITPYTFGISVLGDLDGTYCPYRFAPIIKAGTPIPVTRTEPFTTSCYGQQEAEFNVFEGDNTDSRKNILIGNFTIDDLDEEAPMGSIILAHMSLDLDGILKVTAIEKETGKQKHITIEKAMNRLSGEDLEASKSKLNELFNDAPVFTMDEEESEETADAQAINPKVDTIIKNTESRWDDMDDVDRQDAEKLISQLKEATANGEEDTIDETIDELEDLLFYLDS